MSKKYFKAAAVFVVLPILSLGCYRWIANDSFEPVKVYKVQGNKYLTDTTVLMVLADTSKLVYEHLEQNQWYAQDKKFRNAIDPVQNLSYGFYYSGDYRDWFLDDTTIIILKYIYVPSSKRAYTGNEIRQLNPSLRAELIGRFDSLIMEVESNILAGSINIRTEIIGYTDHGQPDVGVVYIPTDTGKFIVDTVYINKTNTDYSDEF